METSGGGSAASTPVAVALWGDRELGPTGHVPRGAAGQPRPHAGWPGLGRRAYSLSVGPRAGPHAPPSLPVCFCVTPITPFPVEVYPYELPPSDFFLKKNSASGKKKRLRFHMKKRFVPKLQNYREGV
jgi:hypothetical protein